MKTNWCWTVKKHPAFTKISIPTFHEDVWPMVNFTWIAETIFLHILIWVVLWVKTCEEKCLSAIWLSSVTVQILVKILCSDFRYLQQWKDINIINKHTVYGGKLCSLHGLGDFQVISELQPFLMCYSWLRWLWKKESFLSSKTIPPTGQTIRVFDNRIYFNVGYDRHFAR